MDKRIKQTVPPGYDFAQLQPKLLFLLLTLSFLKFNLGLLICFYTPFEAGFWVTILEA